MLHVPPEPTTTVPSTVVVSDANRVMVSPGAPVPVIAGLGLLVSESVVEMPVSLLASWVRLTLVGVSSTGIMSMLRMSVSLCAPPSPVLPPSLVTMVNVTEPLALLTGTYTGVRTPVLKKLLIWATVPASVMLVVPLPVTVTPPAVAAVSLPLETLNVTVTEPGAASASLICKLLSTMLLSSSMVKLAGSVLTGASLMAATLMLTLPVVSPPLPSCTT